MSIIKCVKIAEEEEKRNDVRPSLCPRPLSSTINRASTFSVFDRRPTFSSTYEALLERSESSDSSFVARDTIVDQVILDHVRGNKPKPDPGGRDSVDLQNLSVSWKSVQYEPPMDESLNERKTNNHENTDFSKKHHELMQRQNIMQSLLEKGGDYLKDETRRISDAEKDIQAKRIENLKLKKRLQNLKLEEMRLHHRLRRIQGKVNGLQRTVGDYLSSVVRASKGRFESISDVVWVHNRLCSNRLLQQKEVHDFEMLDLVWAERTQMTRDKDLKSTEGYLVFKFLTEKLEEKTKKVKILEENFNQLCGDKNLRKENKLALDLAIDGMYHNIHIFCRENGLNARRGKSEAADAPHSSKLTAEQNWEKLDVVGENFIHFLEIEEFVKKERNPSGIKVCTIENWSCKQPN